MPIASRKGLEPGGRSFFGRRKAVRAQIRDLSARGRTSYSLEEIIPASLDGRVETLFLQGGLDKFGVYDQEKRSVLRVQSKETITMSHCLTWLPSIPS